MTPEELADRIADFVSRSDYVSQGELINRFGDSLRGATQVYLNPVNVVLFVGCSELFADAVCILQQERPPRVVIAPAHPMVLFIDGCPVPAKMPWMKGRPPKGGYKRPRFAPVCFRPAPEGTTP